MGAVGRSGDPGLVPSSSSEGVAAGPLVSRQKTRGGGWGHYTKDLASLRERT